MGMKNQGRFSWEHGTIQELGDVQEVSPPWTLADSQVSPPLPSHDFPNGQSRKTNGSPLQTPAGNAANLSCSSKKGEDLGRDQCRTKGLDPFVSTSAIPKLLRMLQIQELTHSSINNSRGWHFHPEGRDTRSRSSPLAERRNLHILNAPSAASGRSLGQLLPRGGEIGKIGSWGQLFSIVFFPFSFRSGRFPQLKCLQP